MAESGTSAVRYWFLMESGRAPAPASFIPACRSTAMSGLSKSSNRFTYIAKTRDGSVSGVTSAFITVIGPIRRLAVAADSGAAPTVTVYDATTNNHLFTFNAFAPDFRGGVRVATGDFNGDNVDDI